MFFSVKMVNALTIGDCEVLVSFKLQSSLDEDTYICKDKKFGSSEEGIYYSGEGSTIVLRDFNASASYTYALNYAGTKQFAVTVKDSTGKTVSTERITVKASK